MPEEGACAGWGELSWWELSPVSRPNAIGGPPASAVTHWWPTRSLCWDKGMEASRYPRNVVGGRSIRRALVKPLVQARASSDQSRLSTASCSGAEHPPRIQVTGPRRAPSWRCIMLILVCFPKCCELLALLRSTHAPPGLLWGA